MNLIATITNFFRPVPAVVMQDDHEFLLDDPTIVEIRQNTPVSDVQLAAMNQHSQAFLQNMHHQAAGFVTQKGGIPTGGSNMTTLDLNGQMDDEAYREACHAAIQMIDQQMLVAPPGTFPLPDDAQLHYSPTRDLSERGNSAPKTQLGGMICRPSVAKFLNDQSRQIEATPSDRVKSALDIMQEENARMEVADQLAANTGAGSPRSQLMYQLNLIRDAILSAQNMGHDIGYDLPPKILELYEDSFSAFVHEQMGTTVTLICQLYKEDRDMLFEVVENLGYILWSPDKGKNLYLKILTRTAKIHL